MRELISTLWRDTGMTIFMVTHDIKEGFALATRVVVLDKWRHDPQEPNAYGATITYDLRLTGPGKQQPADSATNPGKNFASSPAPSV
jgi:NitT/TauT family transport system ATP-binding protein